MSAMSARLFALLALPFLAAVPARAEPTDAERAAIEKAYDEKLQAERDTVQKNAVAARARELRQDARSPVLGNPDGDVTVIEFFDYQCPFCKAIQPRLESLLQGDGKVRLVVKDFPILGPESVVAAKAALAAARQGRHAAFHVAMMNRKGKLEIDQIWETAKSVGLDVERLRRDLDAPEIADTLLANFNLARAIKVTGTPGLLVEDKVLTGPSKEFDFAKEVAAARQKAR